MRRGIGLLIIIPLASFALIGLSFSEYKVGIGDVLNVRIWEHEELGGTVTVGPDGTITLPPPIGTIQVDGLTPGEIAGRVKSILSQYLRGELQVIVQVTQFNSKAVYIFGEVASPGRKSAVKPPSLLELIAMAGGLTANADPTDIRVIPADGSGMRRVDLSKFFETGDESLIPQLNAGDIVYVPPKKAETAAGAEAGTTGERPPAAEEAKPEPVTIYVMGRVLKPGAYQFEKVPTLPEVISMAGGVPEGYLLRRVRVVKRNESITVDMKRFMETGDASLLPELSSGDIVYVPEEGAIERMKKRSISVIGAVNSPGSFTVEGEINLIDAIAMAGGLSQEADPTRVTVTRETPDFIQSQEFDLTKMKEVPVIKPGDKIFVPRRGEVGRTVREIFGVLRDILFIYSTYLIITR